MRYGEGDILRNPEDQSYGLVLATDSWDGKLTVLQFGPDGPYVRDYDEYDADSIFEVDDG